ncbi:hypothetical protein ACIHCX_14760 [Streptomyces sp. NPDC052043]|uniref:hypothetical protein n=1 Tax=Streptomyces sp. NPDC052043 TaxID=3365684 RepID=UPI0037D32734
MSVAQAGVTLADPTAYADEDRLHRALDLLRREAPVHWVTPPATTPSGPSPAMPTSGRWNGAVTSS